MGAPIVRASQSAWLFIKRNVKKYIMSLSLLAVVAMAVTFLMTSVIVVGTVESSSMNNSLREGDKVIGFRLAYLYKPPERGDVVVFRSEEGRLVVKRVIGLPGDVVEFVSGQVFINNKPLQEPYTRGVTLSSDGQDIFYVPDKCVLLLGDNREYSEDSREWQQPYVTVTKLKARVFCKYTPLKYVLSGEREWSLSQIR